MAQWLRIRLPMQGTRVRALVREDPTCREATRPVSHNYWACASGACAPQRKRPRQWEARAPRWRVDPALAATRESPRTEAQHSQKKKKRKKNDINPWLKRLREVTKVTKFWKTERRQSNIFNTWKTKLENWLALKKLLDSTWYFSEVRLKQGDL